MHYHPFQSGAVIFRYQSKARPMCRKFSRIFPARFSGSAGQKLPGRAAIADSEHRLHCYLCNAVLDAPSLGNKIFVKLVDRILICHAGYVIADHNLLLLLLLKKHIKKFLRHLPGMLHIVGKQSLQTAAPPYTAFGSPPQSSGILPRQKEDQQTNPPLSCFNIPY